MEISKHARIVRGLIVSVAVLFVGGLCALTGLSLEQDDLFEAWGTMIKMLGVIMLVAAGLGLLYGLGRLGTTHGVIPRRLPSLFLAVTVVVLGLLAGVYFTHPYSGSHLRLQYAMGERGFSGLTLERANLRGAKLDGIHLNSADLEGADLSGADLTGANLYSANLSGANLSGADLEDADLGGAKLNGADLSNADLTGADLKRADLSYVNLQNSKVTAGQLVEAKSLKGAIMPDGSMHE